MNRRTNGWEASPAHSEDSRPRILSGNSSEGAVPTGDSRWCPAAPSHGRVLMGPVERVLSSLCSAQLLSLEVTAQLLEMSSDWEG